MNGHTWRVHGDRHVIGLLRVVRFKSIIYQNDGTAGEQTDRFISCLAVK
jgi:hypothetical protein